MSAPTPAPHALVPAPPLVLLASRDEVFARTLESVLTPAGYAVLRAYTARSAREQAARARPDAVVLATDLENPSGLELCRQLRAGGDVTASTPIVLTDSGSATRQSRLEALRAGADQLWSQPMDPEEFALRLAAGVRAKRDADAARAEGLVDLRTGLWNERGLIRCAAEQTAQMVRAQAPLTLAVLSATGAGAESDWALGDRVGAGLRRAARRGDVVGRLGVTRFAVVAPRTDQSGAVQLAQRLLAGVRGDGLRVGMVVLEDAARAPAADELVARAVAALERGDAVTVDGRVRQWRRA